MLTPHLSVQSRHRVCPKYKAYNRDHATGIECCEKEKRYTTQHRDGTHTHDEHLSARGGEYTFWRTHRKSGQRAHARAAQGVKDKEKTCSDYHRNEEWVAARDGAPVL